MDELEKGVRAIEMDGLVWGGGKRVPVGYGIFKLQRNLVVEDEKISLEELQGKIEEDEDHVQSSDVVSIFLCPQGEKILRAPFSFFESIALTRLQVAMQKL